MNVYKNAHIKPNIYNNRPKCRYPSNTYPISVKFIKYESKSDKINIKNMQAYKHIKISMFNKQTGKN